MPVEVNHAPTVRESDSLPEPSDALVVTGLVLAGDYNVDPALELGSITWKKNEDTSVSHLRKSVQQQIAHAPQNYIFLSKEGWPVAKDVESKVSVSRILTDRSSVVIRKYFDKARAGIVTTSGACLGFVFIDLHATLAQVRDSIEKQLQSRGPKTEYRFIEKNGWPVTNSQENLLTLADILTTRHIIIELGSGHLPTRPSISTSESFPVVHRNNKSLKGTSHNSILRAKDEGRTPIKNLVAKTILISYVRAEAVQNAVALKSALSNLGFSVFLDVHEIKTGSDWQDALNYAVSNCRVFVPLVTPMYGKTQWTNREVKLADVLNKIIIPVNFLDQWPPECLAIQFATTQYVSSRWVLDGEYSESLRVWEQSQVKRVSEDIAGRCKAISKSCLPGQYDRTSKSTSLQPTSEQIVVISAHPKQLLLTHQMKKMLEQEGYKVWCSIHTLENPESEIRDLLTIPEEPATCTFRYSGIPEDFRINRYEGDKCLSSIGSEIGHVFSFSPEKLCCLKNFQLKVDEAGVVIVLVSAAYTKSRTSQQQIFYCEHRKQLVLVKCDDTSVPTWFNMLMGRTTFTMHNCPQFEASVKARIKRALDPYASETTKVATEEAKMQYLTTFLKKHLPANGSFVYIVSSYKFQNPRSESICKAIGASLAMIDNVTLVTGGFYGSCDLIAESFIETRNRNGASQYDDNPQVVHVVPVKDSQDFSQKARQNSDGTFENVPYGKTIFLGDSVKERETAVARVFDTCILVEGGPNTAHEVEQFIWNDHFVVPVVSTGGTAGGQFGVSLQMLETPPCVNEMDWNVLSDRGAAAEEVAQAVVRIVSSLKQALVSQDSLPKMKSRDARKSKTKGFKSKNKRHNSTDGAHGEAIRRKSVESVASNFANNIDDSLCLKWEPLRTIWLFLRGQRK